MLFSTSCNSSGVEVELSMMQQSILDNDVSYLEILNKVRLNYLENQSKLYLYGDSSMNNSDNKKIILSTIKYIKDTQRFLNILVLISFLVLFVSIFVKCVVC